MLMNACLSDGGLGFPPSANAAPIHVGYVCQFSHMDFAPNASLSECFLRPQFDERHGADDLSVITFP